MDAFRYVMALLLVVMLPPALLYWLLIHPFARFWRTLGAPATFAIVGAVCFLFGAAIYRFREPLLSVEYGFRWPLVATGAAFYLFAVVIEVLRRRHLKFHILAGVPEVSAARGPGKLLTEGIYGRIRHPRYLGLALGLLGWALFLNYLAFYVTLAVSVPVLLVIIHFEDKELAQRFGAEYEAYRRRVPRFLPRSDPGAGGHG